MDCQSHSDSVVQEPCARREADTDAAWKEEGAGQRNSTAVSMGDGRKHKPGPCLTPAMRARPGPAGGPST